ncbi:MAG: tRNA pseudouridine(38-40) synthase TruA [Desulfobacteraceae bacterium]|jgi:tRNA pseudouridine38-40 synthase
MRNYLLTIEYEGTCYHGWQRQRKDRSIQSAIEDVLGLMTNQKISLIGSGRTDAGVHALGQVANFKCDTRLTATDFQKGLNSLLPNDIVITDCRRVPESFHARYDVKSKIYRYRILNRYLPSALLRRFTWHIRSPLDTDAIKAACQLLIGCHDFKAFEGAGSPRSHSIRNIISADWDSESTEIKSFSIEADGFLRFMVRNIVGTLVDVGLGKISTDEFKLILLSKDRNQASATAPPQGLYLVEVRY